MEPLTSYIRFSLQKNSGPVPEETADELPKRDRAPVREPAYLRFSLHDLTFGRFEVGRPRETVPKAPEPVEISPGGAPEPSPGETEPMAAPIATPAKPPRSPRSAVSAQPAPAPSPPTPLPAVRFRTKPPDSGRFQAVHGQAAPGLTPFETPAPPVPATSSAGTPKLEEKAPSPAPTPYDTHKPTASSAIPAAKPRLPTQGRFGSKYWDEMLDWFLQASRSDAAFAMNPEGLTISHRGKYTADEVTNIGSRLLIAVEHISKMGLSPGRPECVLVHFGPRILTGLCFDLEPPEFLILGFIGSKPLSSQTRKEILLMVSSILSSQI